MILSLPRRWSVDSELTYMSKAVSRTHVQPASAQQKHATYSKVDFVVWRKEDCSNRYISYESWIGCRRLTRFDLAEETREWRYQALESILNGERRGKLLKENCEIDGRDARI